MSIGRVVTRTHGQGHGAVLLAKGIETARELFGADAIRISSQCQARGFYEKFGFRQVTGEYLEDNIPHIGMLLTLNPGSK